MLWQLPRFLALGCVALVASTGQAFTAPPSGAAESAGLAVSDVMYGLKSHRIDRITFTVAPALSGRLSLRLSPRGPWRECTVVSGRASCDLSRSPVPLGSALELTLASR